MKSVSQNKLNYRFCLRFGPFQSTCRGCVLLVIVICSVSAGLVMIGVIIGSRKVGINPDNVATPIAASLGDLITLSLLAGVSSTLYEYIGEEIHSQQGR